MSELPDQAERAKALDTKLSFIVQAPAGSGKTELLIQRYLALLSQSPTPESVIAITFTRKAAQEMKERVLQALRFAQQPLDELSESQKTRTKLANQLYHWQLQKQWNLLDQPHRLHIQTIDAFYAELIRKASFSSAFHTSLPIADHPETLYKTAIHHLLVYLEDNSQLSLAIAQLARHLNNDTLQMERLLIYMLAHRDQWVSIIKYGTKGPSQLRRMLEKSLHMLREESYQGAKTEFLQCGPSHWIVSIQNWLRFNQIDERQLLDSDCEAFWLLVVDLFMTQQGRGRQKINTKQNIFKSLSALQKQKYQQCKEEIQNILDALKEYPRLQAKLWTLKQLPPSHYSQTQWSLLKDLFHILSALLQILDFTFQEYQTTDYIAVELKALEILGTDEDPTETLLKYDAYIQHVLIDEVQDISMAQLQFLRKLTAGWQSHDGRTLFLVGDPMQSIYQFRNAEPRLFQFIKKHGIGNCLLHPLTLSSNFRATTSLVKWINHHFSAINVNLPLQFHQSNTFTASISASTKTASNSGVTTHWFEALSLSEEADRIVALVQKILTENTTDPLHDKQPKIAILGRSRQHLRAILEKLRFTDIAYQAIEIETLFDQPIIQDLLALTRALTHPGDTIAWLAILRAPWCGISLKSLHHLMQVCRKTQPAQLIWDQLQNLEIMDLDGDEKTRLKHLVQTLHPSIESYGRLPLYQRVKQAWINLGGPATHSIFKHNARNIDAFFQCLNQVQVGETLVDPTLLEKALEKKYVQTVHGPSQATVALMTVHKAKGLEFDIVILPSLHREVRNQNYPLILFDEQPIQNKNRLLIAPIKSSESFTQEGIYRYLWDIKSQYYQMELVRLFYVACTRAKQHLHLVGGLKFKAEKPILPPMGSLLYWLWPVLSSPQAIVPSQTNQTNTTDALPAILRKIALSSPYLAVPSMTTFNIANQPYPKSFECFTSNHLIEKVVCHLFYYLAEQCLSSEQLLQEITRLKQYPLLIQAVLAKLGQNHQFNDITNAVTQVLTNTLSSAKGRWILLGTHLYHHNHYEFYRLEGSKILSELIHRLLIDEHNRFWLIDYRFDYPIPTQACSIKRHLSLESHQRLLHKAQALHELQYKKLSYQSIHIGLYWPHSDQWLEEPVKIK